MKFRFGRGAAAIAGAFFGGAILAHAIDAGVVPMAGGKGAPGAVSAPASAGAPTADGDKDEGLLGQIWAWFAHPRAADAPRHGEAKPDGFDVWKTRIDYAGGGPAACVTLSRPLDPARSYGDFVSISPSPDHPPAVTVKGDELCIAGVSLAGRKVTLLRGLPSRTGESLAESREVEFFGADRKPYVAFAGSGVILPREDADGVAIETVNVSSLKVKVWRVPDRNLPRVAIEAGEPGEEGGYDYNAGPEEGRLVWQGQVKVKGDGSGKAVTVFPLGAVLKTMAPGGYVIQARDAARDRPRGEDEDEDAGEDGDAASTHRFIIFTDMALTAYGGSQSLDVIARSLKTARVLSGMKVALIAGNGEILAQTRTDRDGHAAFASALLKGDGGQKPKMILAYGPQGDLAELELDRAPVDLSRQGVGGRDPDVAAELVAGRDLRTLVDGFVYADRGVYRPGERAHLVALVRDAQGDALDDRSGYVLVRRPSGTEFRRYLFKRSDGGAVVADVDLPAASPRGRWKAELHIDGMTRAAGELNFAVEDFAPQRLAVTLDARKDVPVGFKESRPADLSARFLYGALAAGLKTQAEARLKADPLPFPKFADYRFGDAAKPFEEKLVDLGASVTDGAGKARILFTPGAEADSPTPLLAQLTASVFEPGGRPVRDSANLKVRGRSLYLGMKVDQTDTGADRDPPMGVNVIAVDSRGERVAAGKVQWTLVAERWNYDWFQQDGRWQWRRTARESVVDKGVIDIAAAAPARLSRRLGWGDYRLELNGPGGARTVQRFSSGWGSDRGQAETPDLVRVNALGSGHVQGQPIDLVIKAPFAGEAQVAVATDHLIALRTLSVGPQGTSLRLDTNAAWGAGAYVMVTVLQPRDPVASPVPRRALGVSYVALDTPAKKLTVEVSTPERLDSHDHVRVPVHVLGVTGGQQAYVTVAAVDEGILQLTNFASPDPIKWFLGKRALSVDYRDDYGRLLDANMGAPANVNFGGDELGGKGLTKTPIRTVALWSGVVKTDRDGRAVVDLPAGEFNGELRVMAVAWTRSAIGSISKPMTVREPVVADLALPRFLAPGDSAQATLELHNLGGQAGRYDVKVAAAGPTGGGAQAPTLGAGQRTTLSFPIGGGDHTGLGKVDLAVAGPGFATRKSYDIETRIGWGAVTRVTTAAQAPGEAYTPPPELMSGLAAGDVTLQVSYSPIRGFDPAAVAQALSAYPYGCTEQLSSIAFGRLYAAEAAGRGQFAAAEIVTRLLDRQGMDGAFGLWRVADAQADPWIGAYATDLLLEARAAGVAVPQPALDRALGAMRRLVVPDGSVNLDYMLDYPTGWSPTRKATQQATERMRSRASAYALYVLAKAGQGDLPRLRWWLDVQMAKDPSPLSAAQVGAGLALMGDRPRAAAAFRQAVAKLAWRDGHDPYQSPLRDLSGVIALAYEAGLPEVARTLQGQLTDAMKDPDRLNDQEQAALLRAARAMLAAAGPVKVEAAGVTAMGSAAGAPRWAVGTLAKARFVNRGAGPIWRTVTVRGTPLLAPPAGGAGLTVTKDLFTRSGGPVDLNRVKQGDRIVIRISGKSLLARSLLLAINDALPAGFEAEAVLTPDDSETGPYKFLGKLTEAGAQERRDDRYVAAATVQGNKSFAVAYVARAVTPGSYFFPGAQAADMYHADVSARSAPGRLTVLGGQ